MELLIMIVLRGLLSLACYKMAEARGRNAPLWAVLGFFLGLLAPVILAIAGDTDDKKREMIREEMGK